MATIARVIGSPAGGGADPLPKIRPGRYWRVSPTPIAGGVAQAFGNCYFHPLEVYRQSIIDRIAADVTTGGATSVLRMGLYRDLNGHPDTLRTEFGTVAADTAGVKELTINETLAPGLWWLAIAVQVANCSLQQYTGTPVDFMTAPTAANGLNFAYSALVQNPVSGALPATAAPTTLAPGIVLAVRGA